MYKYYGDNIVFKEYIMHFPLSYFLYYIFLSTNETSVKERWIQYGKEWREYKENYHFTVKEWL